MKHLDGDDPGRRGRKPRSGKIQRVMHTKPPSDEMKSRGEQVIKSKVVDLVIQR